jgi:G3E family GTPase
MEIDEVDLPDFAPHGYREFTIFHDSPISRTKFSTFMLSVSNFAWRAKGFVIFREDPTQVCLVNMVGKRLTIEPYDRKGSDSGLSSTLVVIGKANEMPETLSFESVT